MKKIKVAMLGLCLVLGLSACGKAAEESVSKDEPNMDEIIQEVVGEKTTLSEADMEVALEAALEQYVAEEKAIEASKEAEEAKVVESIKAERTPVEPKQEILDATWDSGMVQFNDIIVQLPIKLSEMIELGFDYGIFDKSKDYLFAKNDSGILELYLEGEKYFTFIMKSDMEGFHTVEEIDPFITEIQMLERDLSDTAKTNIFFAGGIQLGDNYTVIEERLGTAHNIDNNMSYIYGAEAATSVGETIKLKLWNDRNTQKINMIHMVKKTNVGSKDTMESLTYGDFTFGNSTATVTMNYLKDYRVFEFGGGIFALFQENDMIYRLETQISFKETKYQNKQHGDVVYEQIDEDGTIRRIYCFEEECTFEVIKAERLVNGNIRLVEIGNMEFRNDVDKYMDTVTEVVNSIQF